jgi:hypothetical protein
MTKFKVDMSKILDFERRWKKYQHAEKVILSPFASLRVNSAKNLSISIGRDPSLRSG